MNIEAAWPSDVAAITEIQRLASASYYRAAGYEPDPANEPGIDQWLQWVGRTDMSVACARPDGADDVLGFVCAYDGKEASRCGLWSLELVALYVHPQAWARGIGSALHAWFLAELDRSATAEVGTLYVWSGNTRAQAFYRDRRWYEKGPRRPGPLALPFVSLYHKRTDPVGIAAGSNCPADVRK